MKNRTESRLGKFQHQIFKKSLLGTVMNQIMAYSPNFPMNSDRTPAPSLLQNCLCTEMPWGNINFMSNQKNVFLLKRLLLMHSSLKYVNNGVLLSFMGKVDELNKTPMAAV